MSAARDMLRDLNRERERAAELQQQESQTFGNLAQVARGDTQKEVRKDLQKLRQTARGFMGEEGMSQEEAARLTFQLRSGQMMDQRKTFSRMYGMVEDPSQYVSQISKFEQNFGQRGIGSAQQAIGKMFQASGVTPNTVGEITGGAVRAAGPVGKLGGGRDAFETLLSATAVGSKSKFSPKRVATAIRRFAAKAESVEDIPGDKGLLGAMQSIRKRQLEGPELKELIGSDVAVRGYDLLRKFAPQIRQLRGKMTAERAEGVYQTRVGAYRGAFETERKARATERRYELAKQEKLAQKEMERDIATQKAGTEALKEDRTDVDRFVGRVAASAVEQVGGALEGGTPARASRIAYRAGTRYQEFARGASQSLIPGIGIGKRLGGEVAARLGIQNKGVQRARSAGGPIVSPIEAGGEAIGLWGGEEAESERKKSVNVGATKVTIEDKTGPNSARNAGVE